MIRRAMKCNKRLKCVLCPDVKLQIMQKTFQVAVETNTVAQKLRMTMAVVKGAWWNMTAVVVRIIAARGMSSDLRRVACQL